jgi:hypothetical protein
MGKLIATHVTLAQIQVYVAIVQLNVANHIVVDLYVFVLQVVARSHQCLLLRLLPLLRPQLLCGDCSLANISCFPGQIRL